MKKSIKVNEIEKLLTKCNRKARFHHDFETFVMNADRYIKAIKQNRMICNIGSVSKSGMSRTIKFLEMNGSGSNYTLYEFSSLFEMLNHSHVANSGYFRINGCGMDMIFHTNYEIIHQLGSLGFLNKSQVTTLAQQTPHIV